MSVLGRPFSHTHSLSLYVCELICICILCSKTQINKLRPVVDSDLDTIFKQAKEEQEKADCEFQETHLSSSKEASLASQEPCV